MLQAVHPIDAPYSLLLTQVRHISAQGEGSLSTPRLPKERILEKIRIDGECWTFTGRLNGGYGWIGMGSKGPKYAHRVMWELKNGPVPKGFELDHLCHNRACVNPDHLELVTHKVNMNRSRRTHCRRGHAYDSINTYEWKGQRFCRPCHRIWIAERKSQQ